MTEKTLRARLRSDDVVVGSFQTIDSPMVAEIMAKAGMDFVLVDQEHGPLTAQGSLTYCIAAQQAGAAAVVRVRDNSEAEIQRALDIGADAVQIPQIETVEDAEKAVSASRFAPAGSRGLNPYVRAGEYTGGSDYTEHQNEEVTVIVHIEGENAISNLDDILEIAGIDVLFLGPYDLSQSIGIPGQVRSPRVEELMADVCERAAAAGKVVGTYADDPNMAHQWIGAGAQYVALSVDAPVLHGAYSQLADAFE